MKFVITVFILVPFVALAQNPMRPFNDMKPHIDNYDFYGAKKVLADSQANYNRAHPAFNAYYNQAVATALSMCGYSRDSILTAWVVGTTGAMPRKGVVNVDTIDVKEWNAICAKYSIAELAKEKDVVMISEQHHSPQHRLFVKSILDDMYRRGYRTLALEALNYKIGGYTSVKEVADSGYYTKQAAFGAMVRTALELGYEINGYEASTDDYKTFGNNRDSIQALNLNRIVGNQNGAKTIVYAGYGHIAKGAKKMRTYFENLTKLTVISVDQTGFSESASPMHEAIPYAVFTANFSEIEEPVLLYDGDDDLKKYSKVVDVEIFWPRTRYIHNREHWLALCGDVEWIKVELVAGAAYLAAYLENEYEQYGVKIPPVDYLVVEDGAKEAYLALPRGKKCTIVQSDSTKNE